MCSGHDVKKYQARISGPLRERCDLLVEVPRQKVDVLLSETTPKNHEYYKQPVREAYDIQTKRYKETPIHANAYLNAHNLHTYAKCSESAEGLLKEASKSIHLSARVTHKLLKIARTIADLEHSSAIQIHHMAEALQYRAKHFFIEQ